MKENNWEGFGGLCNLPPKYAALLHHVIEHYDPVEQTECPKEFNPDIDMWLQLLPESEPNLRWGPIKLKDLPPSIRPRK